MYPKIVQAIHTELIAQYITIISFINFFLSSRDNVKKTIIKYWRIPQEIIVDINKMAERAKLKKPTCSTGTLYINKSIKQILLT